MNTDANTDRPDDQQPPEEEFLQIRELTDRYGKPVATALCVVLVVTIAAVAYRGHSRKQLREAAEMFFSARSAPELEAAMKKSPSSPTAPLAMLKLAKSYFDTGNYDAAMKTYTDFGTKYADSPMASGAELGKAHCIEARGQVEEALSAFSALVESDAAQFLAPPAAMGKARCLEQLGRLAEARAAYEDAIANYPESAWQPAFEERLKVLTDKIGRQAAEPPPSEPAATAEAPAE